MACCQAEASRVGEGSAYPFMVWHTRLPEAGSQYNLTTPSAGQPRGGTTNGDGVVLAAQAYDDDLLSRSDPGPDQDLAVLSGSRWAALSRGRGRGKCCYVHPYAFESRNLRRASTGRRVGRSGTGRDR